MRPRTTTNPTSGAIGPGLPLAIGAAVGTGKKGTVCIHGDGGFMFSRHRACDGCAVTRWPLVVCVFQRTRVYGVSTLASGYAFSGGSTRTDIGKMDFAMMAASMGVPGERVQSVCRVFPRRSTRRWRAEGPYLIDIDMEHFKPMEISIMPKKKTRLRERSPGKKPWRAWDDLFHVWRGPAGRFIQVGAGGEVLLYRLCRRQKFCTVLRG